MKKLNLLVITLLSSSLLIGCGMKGPLYRAPETQTIEKQPATPEVKIKEQEDTITEDETSNS